ncbi:MAG: tetratricopeptide repeat protein [Nitrospinae bacterium]|nr:tetratricopeptide repeat protein [Nitrospinota bacterium]
MDEHRVQGSRCPVKRFLWSGLVMLSLTHAVQASTLTKLRVVDSGTSSQVILSATHPPAYRVIPLLEQTLLVIRLADTTPGSSDLLLPFTSSLIQDIRIASGSALASPPSGTGRMYEEVRVEVVLKTPEVTFAHEALSKPPGILLTVRMGKSATREGDTAGKSPPIVPAPLAGGTAVASSKDHVRFPGVEQSPVEVPQSLPKEDTAAQQGPSRESSLLTAQDVNGFMGGEATGGSATLLELYLSHPKVFLTSPSLLWQVAATYADLALYDEAVALYNRILEQADNPLLQAATLLKRGKMALLQGEWDTAETLLQHFVKERRYGPFLGEAYEALGDVLAMQGKFGGAVEAYVVALSLTPAAHTTAQTLYKLGRAQKKVGNWVKAAEAFQSAIDRLPLQASPPNSFEFRVSSIAFTTKPDPRPSSVEMAALQELGESSGKAHQYEKAATAYRRVVERFPEDWQTAWARYYLGKSYEQLGRHDEALQVYQDLARQVDPLWAEMGTQALADMRWRGRYPPD